jgi:anti-sigma factor RsiW
VNVDDEKRLQEYLDGRLSESERSAFELRLKADAQLQRKARAALELRKNLREDAAELPPGFYARARERFEQTGPGRGRRWFRLLSWESAGLAAAVALAAV